MKKYNELTTKEKLIHLSSYPEEAKRDKNWIIRDAAYAQFGFPEEAKKIAIGLFV